MMKFGHEIDDEIWTRDGQWNMDMRKIMKFGHGYAMAVNVNQPLDIQTQYQVILR